MPLTVDVCTDLDAFARFPWTVYKGDPNWVPPLLRDEKFLLNRRRHPFHKHADVEYFVARRDGAMVGRIAAIVNRAHNDFHNERVGFFGFFDALDDPEAAAALFGAAEAWLKQRGMTAVRGPCNFSTNETCGLLVDGFDKRPFIMMTYNPERYVALVESNGYVKAKNLLAYFLVDNEPAKERLRRIGAIVRRRYNVVVRDADLSRFDQELALVQDLYNRSWQKNWGFVPMTPEEIALTAHQLRPVILSHLTYFAEIDGKPVGFALGVPDVNQILRHLDGRLFPFGWWKLWRGIKKIPVCRIIALGVLPEYHTSGIGALFYLRFFEQGPAHGIPMGELSWILEDNALMNRPLLDIGAKPYKTYRIYEKAL